MSQQTVEAPHDADGQPLGITSRPVFAVHSGLQLFTKKREERRVLLKSAITKGRTDAPRKSLSRAQVDAERRAVGLEVAKDRLNQPFEPLEGCRAFRGNTLDLEEELILAQFHERAEDAFLAAKQLVERRDRNLRLGSDGLYGSSLETVRRKYFFCSLQNDLGSERLLSIASTQ